VGSSKRPDGREKKKIGVEMDSPERVVGKNVIFIGKNYNPGIKRRNSKGEGGLGDRKENCQ